MNLWESYQQLPPLPRLAITFSSTLFLLCVVFGLNKWIKKRNETKQSRHNAIPNTGYANNGLIVQKSDGVIYVYIAYWRSFFFPVILTLMLYVLSSGFLNLYRGLPGNYWHHWDKTATLLLVTILAMLLIIVFIVELLVTGYKAIQMEIGQDYVRFRKAGVKGGILLSNKYVTLKYSEITKIDFREAPLIGAVFDIKIPQETYHINLLLTPADKVAVYRILDSATDKWQKKT